MCLSQHDPASGKTETASTERHDCTRCWLLERELKIEREARAELRGRLDDMTIKRDLALASGRDLQQQLDEARKNRA